MKHGSSGRTHGHAVIVSVITALAVLFPAARGVAQPVSFSAPTNLAAGSFPRSVALGDFNVDGMPDLAVANSVGQTVSILLGTGSGAFGAATNFPVGLTPYAVAIGDLDRNGRPDLAVAN